MDMLPVKRALLSVTDKTNLVSFAKFLTTHNIELVSTGGTFTSLTDAELAVTSVSNVTNFPEIMGGRVKTLHPYIHGGILADKDNNDHLDTIQRHGIKTFDIVCVNLYRFADAVQQGANLRDAVEQIDIGGPCMLRAAAKNFHSVLVIPTRDAYVQVQEEMTKYNGKISLKLRKEMAEKTFQLTAEYDKMIAEYLLTLSI